MTISHINLMELSMFKFKSVPPAFGALMATVTALAAVTAAVVAAGVDAHDGCPTRGSPAPRLRAGLLDHRVKHHRCP